MASSNGRPKWDFKHIRDEEFGLAEVQVDIWGGWVFINMDLEAPSLHHYLGVLPAHFERWKPERQNATCGKGHPCNWKVGWEALSSPTTRWRLTRRYCLHGGCGFPV